MKRVPRYPRLKGRVIIVTGSSRGIGRETARVLLASGCSVVINGRDSGRLEKTRRELEHWLTITGNAADHRNVTINEKADGSRRTQKSGSILSVPGDISTDDGVAALIRSTIRTFGRIDGLINNAGVSMRGSINDLQTDTVDRLIRGNILSTILPTVAAIPALKKTGGQIVFVSTIAALWGFPGVSLYSATKAAIERFAQSVDAEFRDRNIRTTVVFLGFVENDPGKEAIGADGTTFHYTRKAQLTQIQAASKIVRALDRRKRRVITVAPGRLLDIAVRFAPTLVSYVLSKSGSRIHAVTVGSYDGEK